MLAEAVHTAPFVLLKLGRDCYAESPAQQVTIQTKCWHVWYLQAVASTLALLTSSASDAWLYHAPCSS